VEAARATLPATARRGRRENRADREVMDTTELLEDRMFHPDHALVRSAMTLSD
jgi:hypothetical protein